MKKLLLFLIVCVLNIGAETYVYSRNPNKFPRGSYLQSCHECSFNTKTSMLQCRCSSIGGWAQNPTPIKVKPGKTYSYINGNLVQDK